MQATVTFATIAIGFVCAFFGVVAMMSGALPIAMAFAGATAVFSGLAAWSYGVAKSWTNKKKTIVGGLIVIVLLVLLIPSGWVMMRTPPPIAVSPSESKLSNLFDPLPDKQLRGKIDVSVYNRGDDPYYQIWVKLIIDSIHLSTANIGLDFPTLENRIKDGEEPHAVGTEAFCLSGFDEKRHEAFLCYINALDPKKTFQIKLTSNFNPKNLQDDQIGRALIQVLRFKSQPGLRLENFPNNQKGSFSGTDTFPEKFKPDKMIVLCPDVKQPLRFNRGHILCTPNSTDNSK